MSLLLLSTLAAAASPTILDPAITAPEGASCRFVAKGESEEESAGPIAVEPGNYRLYVTCDMEHGVLAPAPQKVRVVAGKTNRPKVRVGAARMLVESRRGDVLLTAHVDIFPRRDLSTPLARVPTNRTVKVADGTYDLIVTLAQKKSPAAQVLIENVRLRANKKKIVKADLSDGGLIVSIKRDGKRAEGSARAFRPGAKRDVGLVAAGQELRLPAGRYEIVTELQESFDAATKRREVWIRPKRITRFTESFQTGRLTVRVTADGKDVPAVVRVSHPGEPKFFNYFEPPAVVTLSPGPYDLAITTDAAGPLGKQRMENVVVKSRRLTSKKLDLTRATLSVRVEKNGSLVDFAQVVVRRAGGGAEIRPEDDGAFRLWPGRYEIQTKLESGAKTTDGPFEVKLGQKLTRVLTIDRAFVTVTAKRGKDRVQTKIFVYKRGATTPLAVGKTGTPIEVDPGTYDLKAIDGPDTAWAHDVRLKGRHKVEIALPIPSEDLPELPEGDLPAGDAPPEGDE